MTTKIVFEVVGELPAKNTGSVGFPSPYAEVLEKAKEVDGWVLIRTDAKNSYSPGKGVKIWKGFEVANRSRLDPSDPNKRLWDTYVRYVD